MSRWESRDPDVNPLLTELRVAKLVGAPLLLVTIASGVLAGLGVLVLSDVGVLGRSPAWLALPACAPVCYSILRGRSILLGAIGGVFSALIAFLIVGLYAVWQVACFIITFMGEC